MTNQALRIGVVLAIATGSLFMTFPALCGPPFVTDDPEPTEYRHHEMYLASELLSTKDGRISTLMVEENYGALPDLQLSIAVPYLFNNPTDHAAQQGFGDLEIGAKYRFIHETETNPMMAFYPSIVSPTGDEAKGLGSGGTQIFLPVWLQKTWGNWQTYGGGGYWIDTVSGAGNHWYFGWELQKNISERLTIGGELFSELEELPTEVSSTGFNLGGVYRLSKHHRLLLSLGRGFAGGPQIKFSGFLAYGLTW
jgi:hypothetical protein